MPDACADCARPIPARRPAAAALCEACRRSTRAEKRYATAAYRGAFL